VTAPEWPVRGQIWRYTPVLARENRSDLRLIVSTDAINSAPAVPVLWAIHVVAEPAESLLSVRVDPHGYALAGTLEQVLRRRLTERLDTVSSELMEQVDVGLRALLEL
jgi:mRNA-degrading endonuclease toxin of MazEF toxin-antitoxin module